MQQCYSISSLWRSIHLRKIIIVLCNIMLHMSISRTCHGFHVDSSLIIPWKPVVRQIQPSFVRNHHRSSSFRRNNNHRHNNRVVLLYLERGDRVTWEVYVDQSKISLDRGGSATLDAFMALAPSDMVSVHAAIFPTSFFKPNSNINMNTNSINNINTSNGGTIGNKNSSRGPCIRCVKVSTDLTAARGREVGVTPQLSNQAQRVEMNNNKSTFTETGSNDMIGSEVVSCFDVGNVDSVDKVHRILTKYMQIPGISINACDCLKWKYKGNGYLEAGKIDLAIDSYDKALNTGVKEQEGIILLMRATAYLQRAAVHRTELKSIVNNLATIVPTTVTYQNLFRLGITVDNKSNQINQTKKDNTDPLSASISNAIFRKVLADTAVHEMQFRQTQYKHGLYQYALLQAARDSLRATQLLDNYPNSWTRAGEILSELWKLQQSIEYYNRSIELDPSLRPTIIPIIERLHKRQDLLTNARTYGWSEDTLRLALDVAR